MKQCPKYCVVTMIFNNYEPIREPLEVSENADYICFTDNKDLKSDKWKVIYLEEFDTDEMSGIQKTLKLKHQIYKYIPNLEKYEYVFRIDLSIQLISSLDDIIIYLLDHNYDLSVAPHPQRNNCIDEYFAWILGRNMNIMFLKKFILNTTGYDYKMNGLLETTIMVYHNCPVVWNYMDDVFKIMEHSMNCQDANDQCYSTYILYNYIDKLNVCFHNPSLYRGTLSKYMTRCKHGSNEVEYNDHVTDIWKSKRTIEVFDKIFILPTINFEH